MGKSVCLSQPIGTVVALSSLSLWGKMYHPVPLFGRRWGDVAAGGTQFWSLVSACS